MNISTSGSQILLFERDQQFAGLLTSELQLAGFDSHTARTAVEVFDAISRLPIKLVLVNLAQAAAARREFWVALDTQRRLRGVQVLTFHCSNIASYGPRDPDERSQSLADIEVDGMLGVTNLIEMVRSRLPSVNANTNTMPRIPKPTASSPSVNTQTAAQRPVPPLAAPNTPSSAGSPLYRAPVNVESTAHSTKNHTTTTAQASAGNPAASPVSLPSAQASLSGTINGSQSAYSDKIRAVLYPNQRTWASQGNNPSTPPVEGRSPYETQVDLAQPPSAEGSVLQRLANGQPEPESGESGLAQLSRMVQEHRPPLAESETYNGSPMAMRERPLSDSSPLMSPVVSQVAAPAQKGQTQQRPAPTTENFSSVPLRPAPIQDSPIERTERTGSAINVEVTRRSESITRPNPGLSSTSPASPLASIASAITLSEVPTTVTPARVVPPSSLVPEREMIPETKPEQVTRELRSEERAYTRPIPSARSRSLQEEMQQAIEKLTERQGAEDEIGHVADNAVLLNIMQSLPDMPPLSAQSPQPVVLSGRAIRTLGSVILEGHLVPQSRLEVAQNIQRMLRGVDMNYQLGEILLLFKLLTPDQLLAASLVSYGMITTAQISSLGRIRQELHSIGLEYDLENLLILFRILTPDQLREVKAGWQG